VVVGRSWLTHIITRVGEHPIFARIYDRALASNERAGLADERRRLLTQASGRTLEIGAGTGHNLPHYTEAVTELVLAEPDPHMAKRLRDKVAEEPPRAGSVVVTEAPGEELPFEDESFDTVVSTLVFCTVDNPRASVAEVKRVLKGDGALLFIEHVRAETRRVARFQDLIERPWGAIAGGCHPNRATGQEFAEAGFWIERLDRKPLPGAPKRIVPMIVGVARRPAAALAPDY
jgi:ubiquinone/menaquinone biosynthesis C-methylase UbiE